MVNLELLKSRGIDAEGLRKKLAPYSPGNLLPPNIPESPKTQQDKIDKLRQIIRLRIQAGRESNISSHKLYHALDLAWETPFRQVSTTLLSSLMDKNPDDESTKRTLQAWGFDLSEVIVEVPDPKLEGKTIKRVNVPAFFQVFVPLVRAYVTIRLAKIMNDRRRQPYYKFEPAISNARTRMQAEIITSRIEMMNQQYDYWSMDRQAVFQMLHYGTCFKFPMEEWHEECHETDISDEYKRFAKDTDGKIIENKFERVQKEGIRYHSPHPSRTFIDEAHRASTFNTDTGCEFGGYWKIVRYRDLKDNPKYYNTDRINIGATDWWSSIGAQTYFSTIYNDCTIKAPVVSVGESSDREARMADHYYTFDMGDSPVVYTEYFQKLVPSEFGLGDYDYPLWFRFVIAADDTIMYCAPLPYSPIIYYGYDADELRAHSKNAGLSLEVLPFQDQFSNLMSQYLIAVRQNLTNATFVDGDLVKEDWIRTIRRLGHQIYSELNFFKTKGGKALAHQKQDISKAFEIFRFPPQDTNSIIQAMKVVLDTLERVLVMSSQEVAQAATHEQTREEIRNISSSTSTRLTFTAVPVDLARDATKKQLYIGLMAYGEKEFYAQVPMDRAMTPQDIEGMGFSYDANDGELLRSRRLTVRVHKSSILLESFCSSRDGEDRINNVEGGMAMMNSLAGLMAGPLYPVIGPDQVITLINIATQMMGFPREFQLKNMQEGGQNQWTPQQMQQLQQIVGQMIQQSQQQIIGEVQQGLTPIMDGQQKLGKAQEMLADQQDKLKDKTKSDSDALRERLNDLFKRIEQTPQLNPPNPIIAPNAHILVSSDGSNSTGASR